MTWNMRQGLPKKLHRVRDELAADVAVLQEVRTEGRLRKAGIDDFRTMDWVGRRQNRGLAVMSFGKWKTKMVEKQYDPRLEFVLPAKAKGPGKQTLNVIGCWAMNHRAKFDPEIGLDNQRSQGPQIPEIYTRLLPGPTIVVGDFNNNASWGEPGKPTNWAATVEAMETAGLNSAYHRHSNEDQGGELRHTFRSNSNGNDFHIDHCFVPNDWDVTQVWIGGAEDWLRKGDGSDHAPMVVDVIPNQRRETQ